jgi:hypothetical protein
MMTIKLVAIATMLLVASFLFASQTSYEAIPVLDAADMLGSDALQGAHYRINRQVTNDGRVNCYQLTSDIQDIGACGDLMAMERAFEIEAIVALREIKHLDAYSKGLQNAARASLVLTGKMAENPAAALQDLRSALEVYGKDIKAVIKSAGKHGGESNEEYYAIKDLIGFYRVKNDLAAELGVDPFSSNGVLQNELNDVAWVMFAGGETIELALQFVPMAASFAASLAVVMDRQQLDWNIPPPTLRLAALQAVANMGLDQQTAESVVFHNTCSLRHQMVMISALADLSDISGQEYYLGLAEDASSESECRHYQQLAELIWAGHQTAPLSEIHLDDNRLWVEASDGRKILPIRADYLVWSKENTDQITSLSGIDMVWISGRLSKHAASALHALGIQVSEQLLKQRMDYVRVNQVLLPERGVRQEADTWEDAWIEGMMGYATFGVERANSVMDDVFTGVESAKSVMGNVTSGVGRGVDRVNNSVGDITKSIGIAVDAPPEAQATEPVKSDKGTIDKPLLLPERF